MRSGLSVKTLLSAEMAFYISADKSLTPKDSFVNTVYAEVVKEPFSFKH
ncbi:hypothetical protein D920_02149 [Enterococcus faecalis 13-SD-W-01]|nr:hypothetical protein D920_02149 [Enterococcus faecalis 13-SD-W-01]